MRWLVVILLAASAHAQDLLVSSRFANNIFRYDAKSGAFKNVFATGNGLLNPNGIAIGPDGNLFAGLGDQGAILRLNGQTGAFIDRFVSDTSGTFRGCRGLTFGVDGTLFVADGPDDRILKYDGLTGASLGVAAQSPDMRGPVGLAVATDGTLYVGGALDNAIHVYKNGQQLRVCTGGSHPSITGVELGPDGLLYAATAGGNTILRYRPDTCEYLGVFASAGSTLIYMIFDADNNLIASSFSESSVLRIDRSGKASTLVTPASGGLSGTHDFAFVPASLTARKQQWVAGAGTATGVGGLEFRSSLAIANRGAASAHVQIAFTPRLSSTPTVTTELDVAPGAVRFITDLHDLPGMLTIDSNEPVAVWAKTFGVSARTAPGDAVPAFGAEDLVDQVSLAGLAENAASRTNFGAINVGSTRAEVTITAFSAEGTELGSTHYTIDPHQDTFVPRILAAIGVADRTGVTLRVSSTASIYAWASVIDNASGFAKFVR